LEIKVELERMSMEDIIASWKANCGQVKTSPNGSTYLVIPIPDQRSHFLDLIQALSHYGYSKEEIASGNTTMRVAKVCWSDLITRMSAKEIKRARDIASHTWKEAIAEFFAIELPKYSGPKKDASLFTKKEYREPILDLNPKDRIKTDTSDLPQFVDDEDILAEIAALEAKSNE